MDVEEKRGLKKHDGCWVRKSNTYNVLLELLVFPLLPKKKLMQLIIFTFQHCMQCWCQLYTCHSCRVVNECKIYAKEGAVGSAAAPASSQMSR